MKKVIILIGNGYDPIEVAGLVAKSFGTAKGVIYRAGAANPSKQRKVAIGPIKTDADEENLSDILDTTDGVIDYGWKPVHGNVQVAGMLETELDEAAMPDLPIYEGGENVAPANVTIDEGRPRVTEPTADEPIATVSPQVDRITKEDVRKMSRARMIYELRNSVLFLGLDGSIVTDAILKVGGSPKTEITFPDGSILRQIDSDWEVV